MASLRTEEASELNLYKARPFEAILWKQPTLTRVKPLLPGNRERITVVNDTDIPIPAEVRDIPLGRIPRFHPAYDWPTLSNKPEVSAPADLNCRIRLKCTHLRHAFDGLYTRTEEIAEHNTLAVRPGHYSERVPVITKGHREDIPWRIRQLSSHV